jgi:hypothetical protein
VGAHAVGHEKQVNAVNPSLLGRGGVDGVGVLVIGAPKTNVAQGVLLQQLDPVKVPA